MLNNNLTAECPKSTESNNLCTFCMRCV